MKCFACNINIGPEYFCQSYKEIGDKKLCHYCYADLNETGYLVLEGHDVHRITIMYKDGSLTLMVRKEFFEMAGL